jgi:hypothetical protein
MVTADNSRFPQNEKVLNIINIVIPIELNLWAECEVTKGMCYHVT